MPSRPDGLRRALAGAHQKYAWLINRREGWQGHVWQDCFHSFPMDGAHLLSALRYVELNPVRAGLVATPEAWRWSSARARIAGRSDGLVGIERPGVLSEIGDWSAFLGEGLDEEIATHHRKHQVTGLPLGGPAFVSEVAALTGRAVMPRAQGRPRAATDLRGVNGISAAARS